MWILLAGIKVLLVPVIVETTTRQLAAVKICKREIK